MQSRFILKRTILSEKTAWLIERRNVYTFEVDLAATKLDVRHAIESVYGVSVDRVRTMRRQSVACRFKGRLGSTSEKKRAVVKLKDGDSIELY